MLTEPRRILAALAALVSSLAPTAAHATTKIDKGVLYVSITAAALFRHRTPTSAPALDPIIRALVEYTCGARATPVAWDRFVSLPDPQFVSLIECGGAEYARRVDGKWRYSEWVFDRPARAWREARQWTD